MVDLCASIQLVVWEEKGLQLSARCGQLATAGVLQTTSHWLIALLWSAVAVGGALAHRAALQHQPLPTIQLTGSALTPSCFSRSQNLAPDLQSCSWVGVFLFPCHTFDFWAKPRYPLIQSHLNGHSFLRPFLAANNLNPPRLWEAWHQLLPHIVESTRIETFSPRIMYFSNIF